MDGLTVEVSPAPSVFTLDDKKMLHFDVKLFVL